MFREYMLGFGFKNEEINLIEKNIATDFYNTEKYVNKVKGIFQFMIDIGYEKKQIIKMIKEFPKLLDLTISNFKSKVEELEKLGFSTKEIIKITSSFSRIFSISIENIFSKMHTLKDLRYDDNSIKKIICLFPNVLSFANEYLANKFDDIMYMGYTPSQVRHITTSFPNILSLSTDNIREKIVFYDFLEISDFILEKPKFLMQSVELSYARYMFYKSRGIEITEKNCIKLFASNSSFEFSYKINKENLLKLYKYDKDIVKTRRRKISK